MYAKIPLNKVTKMRIVQTNGRKTLAQVKQELGCQYVINCTLYDFKTFEVNCPCRIDGRTVQTSRDGYWSYAFNQGSDFKMVHSKDMLKYKNLFSCCALLKDGGNTYLSYTRAQGGVRGRTAVGIDKHNNLILVCSADGTSSAMSPERLREYMRGLGCMSAIMLDSGGSSQCDFNGKRIYSSRRVANYLCVWTTNYKPSIPTAKCPYKEPCTLVRYGTRGEGARWTQWYLNAVSNAKLSVDGIIGRKSLDAIKSFQKSHGLSVDGICGVQTRGKLKALLH